MRLTNKDLETKLIEVRADVYKRLNHMEDTIRINEERMGSRINAIGRITRQLQETSDQLQTTVDNLEETEKTRKIATDAIQEYKSKYGINGDKSIGDKIMAYTLRILGYMITIMGAAFAVIKILAEK